MEQQAKSRHASGGKKEDGKAKFLDDDFTNNGADGQSRESRDAEHA